MEEERKERCETCRFWAAGEYGDGDTAEECRRYPPTVTPGHPNADSQLLPLTVADFWCGEWQAKPTSST